MLCVCVCGNCVLERLRSGFVVLLRCCCGYHGVCKYWVSRLSLVNVC